MITTEHGYVDVQINRTVPRVCLVVYHERTTLTTTLSPPKARDFARALLKAADNAEGRSPIRGERL